MTKQRLHSDVVKDELTEWLGLTLMQASDGNSTIKLPIEVAGVEYISRDAALCDETNLVVVELSCGKRFSLLIKAGDYSKIEQPNDAMVGRSKAA
jgi:hypothetical protein